MNTKRYTISLCVTAILFAAMPMQAQSPKENFDTFRKRVFGEFQDFRTKMLDDYASFLDSAWVEVKTFSGFELNTVPKPVVAPQATPEDEPVDTPRPQPIPVNPEDVTPPPTVPQPSDEPHPDEQPMLDDEPKPIQPDPVSPELPDVPTAPEMPEIPEIPTIPDTPVFPDATPVDGNIHITVYGLPMSIPPVRLDATLHSVAPKDVAKFWKAIHRADTDAAVESLKRYSLDYHLGDWCTLKAVEAYARQSLPMESPSAQRVFMHYLLLSMDYDVRLGTSSEGVVLLVPYAQKIYGNSYVPVGNVAYYYYPVDAISNGSSIFSCTLPDNESFGHWTNLVINPALRLPQDEQAFVLSAGGLKAEGVVNRNIISLLSEYPHMDVACYAASTADDKARQALLSQLRPQLKEMTTMNAANALLHFVQSGFQYQTDQEQFGREKYFFAEETLYYPACDCEDRSILLAWLVHNLLDLDVVLLGFPGHESTAVALPEAPKTNYTSYRIDGKIYYVCDPTYIGADLGMCMPDFKFTEPEVEMWY